MTERVIKKTVSVMIMKRPWKRDLEPMTQRIMQLMEV
jgi:hypothetical protein